MEEKENKVETKEVRKEESKQNVNENKKEKIKRRTILVFACIVLFALFLAINYRANYLEMYELGEEYINVFLQNLKYKVWIGGINFVLIFIIVFITNSFIKKGLKKFFDQEKKEFPKLPNKSLALIFAVIAAAITPSVFLEKVILFINNTQFGIADPIFNADVGFYMFQEPLISLIIYYGLVVAIALTIYTVVYYIVTFNVYFDGIDGQTLKSNTFIKQLIFYAMIIVILIAGLILLNSQNIVLDNFLELNDEAKTSIVGAGVIENTVKLWGYRILSVVIIGSVYMAIKAFRNNSLKNVIKSLAVVPVYLVILFIAMTGYKAIFMRGSELDKQKSYITKNIEFTKTAYNLKIEENELELAGTITREEADKNSKVINNVPVVNEKVALNSLKQTQTSTEYYTYNSAKASYYDDQLLYISAREINSQNTTYNSEANEYTHGYGVVLTSANKTDENGNIIYVSKEFENEDVKQPRIYYGMETNSVISVSNNIEEFDYPKATAQNATNKYEGTGGIELEFLDKIAVAIKERKLSVLLSKGDGKTLLNRNILQRAKKVMPYLIYDENPYLVIGEDGNLYWVIDAYTVSNEYPYSQRTRINYENNARDINYIRNSVKVIVDAYDGDINFYITDKNDPIIMVYNNMYKDIFKEQSEIPEGISKYFTYSKFLYDIQARMLTMYHDVAADILYRGNDVWQIASYSNSITSSASTQMNPTYAMVKTIDSDESKMGLVLPYNLYERESMNAYLVGTIGNDGMLKLSLYKFSNDNSAIGPMQLESLMEQDETISKEILSLNVTGTRITKEMIIVPVDNTLLYVIPIYQTSLIETNSVPVLKKVVVASGNKLAIGESFSTALKNLLSSNYSVSFEVEDSSTIEGLVQMIIRANNNLTESNQSNDWSQIGRDIDELQGLVRRLEEVIKNQEEEDDDVGAEGGNNRNEILYSNSIIQ